MARLRLDGSVYSENTPSEDFEPRYNYYGIYRVLLTAVHYTDDAKNIFGKTQTPEVTYDGVIIGGKDEGQQITNIRDAYSATGEIDNYSERTYRVCSRPLTGTNSLPVNQQDGAIVYVAMLAGNKAFPVIIGAGKSGLDVDVTGATRAESPRRIWEYNGVFFQIDNLGQLTISRKGGALNSLTRVFTPADSNEISLQWAQNQKMSLTFQNGMSFVLDGSQDSATVKTAGGGELKLQAGKVALGTAPTETLAQISASLQDLITFANSEANHVHLGNLGYLTSNPTTFANWTALASGLSGIKALIDGIRGSL
jgi:hypothetical protein